MTYPQLPQRKWLDISYRCTRRSNYYSRIPCVQKVELLRTSYKNKGTPADIKFYRSILVGSNATKHRCAFIRAKLRGTMVLMDRDSTRGGRPKRGTTMATHVLRSVIELGRATGRTATLPLCDLENAHYEVIREMILPMGTDPMEIHAKLETYGIP